MLEKFTFKDINDAYRTILNQPEIEECVILQTCNRVELYAAVNKIESAKILDIWSKKTGTSGDLSKYLVVSEGKDVINHLLRLTSGLESLVVGENQILGQVKRAFELAKQENFCGSYLSIIFDRSIKIGIRIRNQTGLNKGSVSVGSMAVNLAEEYFDNLNAKKVLLIGTGEGATLIAKSLSARNVGFFIASRTFERAKSFASTVGGTPVEFEKVVSSFHEVDLIFVSTTAPYYLVPYDRIDKCMVHKKDGMMIFDLSNPRTVDDKIASIHGVKLVNIDQISEIVERNLKHRQQEIRLAEEYLANEMNSLETIFRKIKAEPFVVSVFKKVDELRERELKKAARMLNIKPGTREFAVIEKLSCVIVEGIMSTPMNNFRNEIGENERNEEILKIVSRIFNYEPK